MPDSSVLVAIDRYAVIEGRKLAFISGRTEPLIEEDELAVVIGQTIAQVRQHVARLGERGFYAPGEIFCRSQKIQGKPGPAAAPYLFTEWQAYVLISQSRSKVAAPLTRAMAQTYEAWRRAQLSSERIAENTRDARMDDVERAIAAIKASQAAAEGKAPPLIGKETAKAHILDPLLALARIAARTAGEPGAISKHRGKLEQRLRKASRFESGSARSWANLPTTRLGEVALVLNEIASGVRALAKPLTSQLVLREDERAVP